MSSSITSSSNVSSKISIFAKVKKAVKNFCFKADSPERLLGTATISTVVMVAADFVAYKQAVKITHRKHTSSLLCIANVGESLADVVKDNNRKDALKYLGYTVVRSVVLARMRDGINSLVVRGLSK